MVDYKLMQRFDMTTLTARLDEGGAAAVLRGFDSTRTPVHLHISRSLLERLVHQATRELERVPKPSRSRT